VKGHAIRVDYWYYLCFNSPYRDYMLAQIREIASYSVTGFWLDATERGTTIESQRRALAVVNKRHQALHRWVDGGRPPANLIKISAVVALERS